MRREEVRVGMLVLATGTTPLKRVLRVVEEPEDGGLQGMVRVEKADDPGGTRTWMFVGPLVKAEEK